MLSDDELLAIAWDFRVSMLGAHSSAKRGMMVCAPLSGYLAFCDVEVAVKESMVGATNHIWLCLPDGRVLDPTVDQFDASLPSVYLGPPLPAYHDPVAVSPSP